jgi:hypothetical protein
MMKRLTAWALAALMMISLCAPALADTYTLAEKFYLQAFQESAYRGTVTMTVEGNGSALFKTAGQWATLKHLAPLLSLTLEHTTTRDRDEGQFGATLLMNEKESIKTTLMYDDKLLGVSSTLMGGDSAYFTFARDWDLSRMTQALFQGDSAWPPVWRMLLAAQNASDEWKARAKERTTIYETKLGLWLNGYAAFATGRENDISYSELSCLIPAQAVKAEIKQLLVDFYNDNELLTILREIVTAQEAAAYLQPAVMNDLFAMLDQLNLQGDVKIVRRYNSLGGALLDSITLPFGEKGLLSQLTISLATEEAGQKWILEGTMNDTTEFALSCLAGGDFIYTGSVDVLLPQEEDTDFVVSDGTEGRKSIAFDYNFSWEPGEDQYTLANDRFTRDMKGSLLIRPRGESNLPEQSVVLEAQLASGSYQRTSTHLDGTLTWRDMESGASITLTLDSRTVSPFAYTTPSNLTNAVRVDLMNQESRSALVQSWLQRSAIVFAQLISNTGIPALSTVQP